MTTSDPEAHRRLALAAECGREAKRLEGLLEDAHSIQWDASRAPRSPGDPGIRSKGAYSDPTPRAALDERRLSLRAEIRTADRLLLQAVAQLRGSAAALERALDAWAGYGDDRR